MPDIRLSPLGRLVWEASPMDPGVADTSLADAFSADWREGLFLLAARGDASGVSPTMRFWGRLGAEYLTQLCHNPDSEPDAAIGPPSPELLQTLADSAPPMTGGEYLTPALLADIWCKLVEWAGGAMEADGGVGAFLAKRAPRWKQVGRVTFHLAENKQDESRPFAFMASFTTGLGSSGQLKHLPLRKALQLYADAGDKPALLKLLIPVHEAAKSCEWVKKLVESGDIYRPMAWPASRAYQMLRSAELLMTSGLAIRLPNWWRKRPGPRVKAVIGENRQTGIGVKAMLDFRVGVALGDQNLSEKELRQLLSGPDGLVLFKGQWIEVDRERLQQALSHWKQVEQHAQNGQLSFIEGMRLLAGAPADLKEDAGEEEWRQWVRVSAGKAMRETLKRLRHPKSHDGERNEGQLKATLRPYQKDGAAWLHFLTELGLGACLADDMGLGKTLQVLALLTRLKASEKPGRPSLLVMPASLLGNWRNEARRFAPGLRMTVLHPSETSRKEMDAMAEDPETALSGYDLAATTYSMLGRMPWLAEATWRLIILDEAQAIKNHATRQSRAARQLKGRARIVLTGTPVENRIGDLWSLFDFLNPGLLGSAGQFKDFIRNMENRTEDIFGPLRRLVGPYILRRLKTDRHIIADLPDKTEVVSYCFLTKQQAKLYQSTVNQLAKALDGADKIARRGLVLQTLVRLKQLCNHPSQFTGDQEYLPGASGKFTRLREICEELAERQERVLVFSQFREIIPALKDQLEIYFGRPGLVLHGGTSIKQRKTIVEQFQRDDGPPFFILSLKAGGTGLNLTAASQVIHFDRWWNPAVEDQATDRAFRIGQKKNVLVHKFVTRGTIEERIDKLMAEKRKTAEQLLSTNGEMRLTELSDDELMKLVRLDVARATQA